MSQSIPNTISSGSGDDHLLTAHADTDDVLYNNKNYHDNRAFQYHNNNSLKRKGAGGGGGKISLSKDKNLKDIGAGDEGLDVLDVVIVHKGYRKALKEDALTNNICSCKHQQALAAELLTEPRKRHNATQTPTSLINWEQRSVKQHQCTSRHEHRKQCNCCYKHCTCLGSKSSPSNYCTCSEIYRCHHHCQHNITPNSVRCCSSHQHHHHPPPHHNHEERSLMTRDDKGVQDFTHWPVCLKDPNHHKSHKRCSSGRHYRPSHKYHLHQKHGSSVGHLPNTCTKSSLDSSDDPNQRLSAGMQEIAIEIDAATMTDEISTTATSNFAFKVAADSAIAPIIRAPLHIDTSDMSGSIDLERLKRRSSFNSNTTIETDELSNEEVLDVVPVRRSAACCVQCYCHRCVDENERHENNMGLRPAQNESVKIKRKRFIAADDYDCSSCSRCSSCSCNRVHSSSCSSFEEWPLEGRHSVHSAPVQHNFTVSADCHRCLQQRPTTVSSLDDIERNGSAEDELQPQLLVQETTDSSARTSRRSSVSFCSCNSYTCCYCSASCEDSTTGHMCTARDATIASLTLGKLSPIEGDEGHSSTLTPLTNPSSVVSTPGDEADVTICSISNALSEDTSSQSRSAEYFSLSSAHQPSQGATPHKLPITNTKNLNVNLLSPSKGVTNVTVIDTNTTNNTTTTTSQGDESNGHKSHKPCKHYSKHHRHKRNDSPLDSYL